MSLVGCCFCHAVVPVRPVRWLLWGLCLSVFVCGCGAFILSSILAPLLLWGGQRHAPPVEIGFGWGFLWSLFGGRFAPVPRGASPPPSADSDKVSL